MNARHRPHPHPLLPDALRDVRGGTSLYPIGGLTLAPPAPSFPAPTSTRRAPRLIREV